MFEYLGMANCNQSPFSSFFYVDRWSSVVHICCISPCRHHFLFDNDDDDDMLPNVTYCVRVYVFLFCRLKWLTVPTDKRLFRPNTKKRLVSGRVVSCVLESIYAYIVYMAHLFLSLHFQHWSFESRHVHRWIAIHSLIRVHQLQTIIIWCCFLTSPCRPPLIFSPRFIPVLNQLQSYTQWKGGKLNWFSFQLYLMHRTSNYHLTNRWWWWPWPDLSFWSLSQSIRVVYHKKTIVRWFVCSRFYPVSFFSVELYDIWKS